MKSNETGMIHEEPMLEETEVPSAIAKIETPIPEKREFVINRPGFINWSDGKANYPGSHLIEFDNLNGTSATDKVNEFFKQRANLLTIGMWIDGAGHVFVLYTNMLEGEELEEFNEHSRAISMHMMEWREDKAKRKSEAAQKAAEAEAEVKRKLALADHCEKNHGKAAKAERKGK